jgi:putative transposase
MAQLPDVKKTNHEYSEVGSQVLQEVLDRLDKAYKAFFRRIKNGENAGFPRFKGKGRYDSFTLKNCGWKLDGRYLTIRNVGMFKIRLSREIQGDIKTVIVRKEATGKWYVCFSCDNVPEKKLAVSDKSIGLDVGIKSFLVDSNGKTVDNPAYHKKTLCDLRRKQRVLARRKKGGSNRNKARILVSKAHEKVKNQRRDFLQKLSTEYIRNYGLICVEDLNIKGLAKNHNLARSINDAGWATFISMLEYKAEEAGRRVVKISRFEPSSKTCSACGSINHNLKLSDRQWMCDRCGTLHDRDFNAAKNICRVGQTLQEQTYAITQSVS